MPDRPHLPTGIVTFLFTDIEGSTRLIQSLGRAYLAILEEPARLLRAELKAHAGMEVGTEGDSLFAAFRSPIEAVTAAVAAQRSLADLVGGKGERIKVRMGLHTGRGEHGGDDYGDLGMFRLKDLDAAERLFQLVIDGLPSEFPPIRTARPGNLAAAPTTFVGRAEAARL